MNAKRLVQYIHRSDKYIFVIENKNIINQEKLVIIVNSQLFACKPDTQSSCCFINFS